MKKNGLSRYWFIVGILSAATFGAFANLPGSGSTSGSMAPTEEVSEIRAKRHADLSFDQDLKRLSSIQGRYRENLPLKKRRATRARAAKPTPKKRAPRARAQVGQR
jgi:hypothetical protein